MLIRPPFSVCVGVTYRRVSGAGAHRAMQGVRLLHALHTSEGIVAIAFPN